MMTQPRYPLLFQINTRVYLTELSGRLGRSATLDDIPDAELDQLAADGFDLVWLLGVWQTGEASRQVSVSIPELLAEYRRVLPDYQDADVCGSCFAVHEYHVHTDFGGDEALARLRQRLHRRGLRLMLDFVPRRPRGAETGQVRGADRLDAAGRGAGAPGAGLRPLAGRRDAPRRAAAANLVRPWAEAAGAAAPPGTVLSSGKDGIVVMTGGGALVLDRVQLPGKRAVTAPEFARAQDLTGRVLG